MAVYKPTYCQPYLSSVDPRCAVSSEDLVENSGTYSFDFKPKFECLSCKVDTSNINVTGYSIKLLDENNNVIFPVSGTTISPITELQGINELGEENSGVNGTVLKIPFFQNCNIYRYGIYDDYVNFSTTDAYIGYYIRRQINQNYICVTSDNKEALEIDPGTTVAYERIIDDEETLLKSHNAIYYKPKYLANHIIMGARIANSLNYERSDAEKAPNWVRGGVDDYNLYWNPVPPVASSNYLYLDSKPVFDGDIVFVATQRNDGESPGGGGGLYRATVRSTEKNYNSFVLEPVVDYADINDGDIITVTNGDNFHNCSFVIEKPPAWGGAVFLTLFKYNNCWVDFSGENVLLPINSSSIKWILTLYQGNSTTILQSPPMSIDYSEIDEKYFDIKLSTGTILGSTPERVQIASSDPIDFWGDLWDPTKTYDEYSSSDPNNNWVIYFDGNGEFGCSCYQSSQASNRGHNPATSASWNWDHAIEKNELPIIYLPQERSGPIVLKDKFMALSSICKNGKVVNGSDELFTEERVAIKSYDTSYGHVYPETNKLETEVLASATHCQFFKSSNNPDEILETDMVQWGVNAKVPLLVFNEDSPVTARIVIDDRSPDLLPTSIFTGGNCKIGSGELVLLTGQGIGIGDAAKPYQNGVYQYNYLEPGSTSSEYGDYQFKHQLKRVSPYNNWGSYLGKIFYCSRGDYAGTNVSCLASAGGALWDPNATGGNGNVSPLLFTSEIPILLFPQLIPSDNVVDFYYDILPPASNTLTGSGIPLIDSEIVNKGDFILFNDGSIYTVSGITGTDNYTISLSTTTRSIVAGNYAYVLGGQNYGQRVLRADATSGDLSFSVTWDLHTARILKNMPVLTYISPYAGTRSGMALSLFGKNSVVYFNGEGGIVLPPAYEKISADDPSEILSNWIRINLYDDTLSYIVHARIKDGAYTNIPSERFDQSYGLLSYSDDPEIPWKYDLYSYFNESNENSFSILESPYLIFNKDGHPYVELMSVSVDDPDFPADIISLALEDNIYDAGLELSYYKYKNEDWYETKRFINIITDYVCFNSGSWESYRWLLIGANGDIIQDTGYKYDNNLNVSFYGLTIPNSLNEHLTYYAVLLLTDNINKNYCSVIQICTSATQSQPNVIGNNWSLIDPASFSAVLDGCSSSVLLSLSQELLQKDASATYSFYRREFEAYRRPGRRINGYLDDDDDDDGQFYYDAAHHNLISPQTGYIYVDVGHCSLEYEYINDKFVQVPAYGQYIGEWEPVLLGVSLNSFSESNYTDEDGTHYVYTLEFRDYHVSAGHSYQYIVYCSRTENNETIDSQLFANWDVDGIMFESIPPQKNRQGAVYPGGAHTASINGAPVRVNWDFWNMVELVPEKVNVDSPVVKKAYKVDLSQVWQFKFSLETGAQTQNISRSEFQTLGEFPRIGFGRSNYVSGDVSALLGSEVIPYAGGYIERLSKSPLNPASTNERVALLNQWRKFVYSKNPKLLRDIKGQQWIVQIVSSSNTPKNFYRNQPDTISFQWKQIGDTQNTIIYADGGDRA